VKIGILTVSDRASSGEYDDQSGPLISRFFSDRLKWETFITDVTPDEFDAIKSKLLDWCDVQHLDLIVTTGGTGFAPRDMTPEATKSVIERETPGLMEAIRSATLKITPHAMLSRAVSGIRGQTLIINLPGSPKAIYENLEILQPVLPHALALLTGRQEGAQDHNPPRLA
jgi:molybdenum cofactor synthesis domain-containing protein